jgi:hypothetical protein
MTSAGCDRPGRRLFRARQAGRELAVYCGLPGDVFLAAKSSEKPEIPPATWNSLE